MPAFANRESQALFQRDRRDQRYFAAHVVARHHHFHAGRQLDVTSHVRRAEVELRPVAPVPRPEIEKISSMGIANGLSMSRTGSGTFLSTASINSSIVFSHFASPFNACSAEPFTTAIESPGN